ncbi:hypothetical protein [Streptomyces sp. KL116D]|uniref:hypothetical protein n=1 Tax=Streptomyces sp. KL116D TaxID=3045152 RepID=UPI0035589AE6
MDPQGAVVCCRLWTGVCARLQRAVVPPHPDGISGAASVAAGRVSTRFMGSVVGCPDAFMPQHLPMFLADCPDSEGFRPEAEAEAEA